MEHVDQSGGGGISRIPVIVHSRGTRVAGAMFGGLRAAGLPAILVLLFVGDEPVHPLVLFRLVAALWLLPTVAIFVIRRAGAATARVEERALVVSHASHRRVTPLADIVAVRPWWLPLPGSGADVRCGPRCGDCVRLECESLFELVSEVGASADIELGTHHPAIAYAAARRATAKPGVARWCLRFPGFALVPTIPLFRVNQIIAYGGALGEYYRYGLGAYLAGFALYWASLTVYLLLFHAALGVQVEAVTVGAVWWSPRRAEALRKTAVRAAAVLYYAGVPLFLVLRFFPW